MEIIAGSKKQGCHAYDPWLAEFGNKRPYFVYPVFRRPPLDATKVALYARVSTDDQDCEIQLTNLRDFARRWDWAATEYVEKLSGKEGSNRPALNRLLEDVKMKRVDVVLVWKMDRFGRSTIDTLKNIEILDRHKVRFYCPTMGIDTDDKSPTGRFTLTMFAAVAELERAFILERTAGGFKAYRQAHAAGRIEEFCARRNRRSQSGKNLPVGRPRKIVDRSRALKMRREGMSIRQIAAKLDVGRGTAQRLLETK